MNASWFQVLKERVMRQWEDARQPLTQLCMVDDEGHYETTFVAPADGKLMGIRIEDLSLRAHGTIVKTGFDATHWPDPPGAWDEPPLSCAGTSSSATSRCTSA